MQILHVRLALGRKQTQEHFLVAHLQAEEGTAVPRTAIPLLGGPQHPIQGQCRLADARTGGQHDEVAGLESLRQLVESVEAHPNPWREPPLHPIRKPLHGVIRHGLDGKQALGLGIALGQVKEALGRLIHQDFRGLVLFGGLPDQLGAQVDQPAVFRLAPNDVSQHLRTFHIFAGQQLHQARVATNLI